MGLVNGINLLIQRITRRNRPAMSTDLKQEDDRISFHPSRGQGVRRSSDGTTVYKKKKKCCMWSKPANSLSFSNRAVAVDEIVIIQITNMAVIVGFMFQDPESLPRVRSSFDILHRGNGFGVILPKRPVTAVEFYYNREGDVRFKVDGVDTAIFFGVVDRGLQPWILIDMYNSTSNIREMDGDVSALSMESKKESEQNRTCDLCYNASADATLGPCGHDTCCHSCAMKWLKKHRSQQQTERKGCPYCRRSVDSIIRRRVKANK